MVNFQTNNATGEVVIYANPACPPVPCRGYTVRQVDALPAGPGKLVWRDGVGLVRVVPPVPVPATITRPQLGEWLIRAGRLDAVQAVLGAILDPTERAVMANWFEYSTIIERGNAKVQALAQALGMSAADVDDAFRAAAAL